MIRSIIIISSITLGTVLFSNWLGSCRKNPDTNGLVPVQQIIPDSFPPPLYTFNDNPLTYEGIQLGRKLFYDGQLSIDGMHPCSSCHQQIAGFGTYEHDRSHGVNNTHTLRNAPVLFNLTWKSNFHWDGEFLTTKDEAAQPIHGQNEMGENFQSVIAKLTADETYRRQFREVFGYPIIRPEFILKALAQFTGTMISANSRYDRYKKGLVSFIPEELRGYNLYLANCSTCHPEPLFTDDQFHNIGLPVDPLLNDHGRMRITGKKEDSLKFKTPTLRNVRISANYMHDGRFNTLGQVLTHYRTGIQQSATLNPLLVNGINFTTTQTNDVIAFLRTLTDSTFITDPRWSKPN